MQKFCDERMASEREVQKHFNRKQEKFWVLILT